MADEPEGLSRREFLAQVCRGAGLLAAGTALGALAQHADAAGTVWQLDPDKCIQCGKCATECVLNPSAVKVVHEHARCGYCELCFGYYLDQRPDNQEAAENQRCPTDAIKRLFVEDPYYQYTIDEAKCLGCGLCVQGCQAFGNGSLILQARHDRCLNCNQCSIAEQCPAQAWRRVPAKTPYLLRGQKKDETEPGAESNAEPPSTETTAPAPEAGAPQPPGVPGGSPPAAGPLPPPASGPGLPMPPGPPAASAAPLPPTPPPPPPVGPGSL